MREIAVTMFCIEVLEAKAIYFLAAWILAENAGIKEGGEKYVAGVKPAAGILFRRASVCVLCTLLVDALLWILVFIADGRNGTIDYRLWGRFAKAAKSWVILQYTAVYAAAYVQQRKSARNKDMLGLIAVILCAASIVIVPFISFSPEQNSMGRFEVVTLCPLGVVIYDLLFCIVYTMPEKDELKRNIYLQEERIRLQRLNNEKAAQYERRLNEFKKYYMQELDNIYSMYCSQVNAENLKQRLDMLETQARASKAETYCGNHIVNCIIHEQEKLCMGKGIRFSTEMCLAEKTGISDLNLCSIFTNLLNNAVRETVSPGGYIKVTSRYKGDYLMISVTNSIDDEKYVQKRLRNAHGYGLKILQDIACKYNGSFKTSISGGEFCASLILMTNSITDRKYKNIDVCAKASAN